jgi:hypothetical protein
MNIALDASHQSTISEYFLPVEVGDELKVWEAAQGDNNS